MNKPHKWAEVLRAIADGREVQMRGIGTDKWHSPGSMYHIENSEVEWRVKPETIKVKYRVAISSRGALPNGGAYTFTVGDVSTAKHIEIQDTFVRWLTDWIEVEV